MIRKDRKERLITASVNPSGLDRPQDAGAGRLGCGAIAVTACGRLLPFAIFRFPLQAIVACAALFGLTGGWYAVVVVRR